MAKGLFRSIFGLKRLVRTPSGSRGYSYPARLLFLITVSIFIIEAAIMLFFYFAPWMAAVELPLAHALLDSTLLVLILSPVLYFLIFRPLLIQIDERRKAEETATVEKNRAQGYLDVAGVILLVLDTEGRIALLNKRGCDILGVTEEEASGMDWFESFIPERIRGEVRRLFINIISGAEGYEGYFENPVLTKSGAERMVLWHNVTLKERGAPTGVLSSGEDITERKKAEAALRESETRYKLLHETSFDAIVISDERDIILDANPSAEKMFGYGRDELIGMGIAALMPEGYRRRHSEGLRRFLETGISSIQGRPVELEALRKNGEVFPIELMLSSFKIDGSISFSGMVRDITEKKKAEREKELFQARLSQSQKMEAIGRFAGGIAHDFNNILTAIRGNAELVLEDIERASPLYSRIEGIILSVLHASKLTRQLLLFSRGQPFELVPLNVNKAVDNLLNMITRLIGEQITISTELAQDLWTVQADEGNIEQVIMNLAVNAKDAMPEGGTLYIRTRNVIIDEIRSKTMPESRQGNAVCLTISDTGMGMEKDVASRIFEPFFSTKEKGKGLGFGLALVYGIVKQHGGWITVKSEPGRGSTFSVYLPALLIRTKEEGEARARGVRGEGERILLVDEDERVREFARMALSENGYDVAEAAGGAEAAEVFQRAAGSFDLVITDLALSDRSAFQLIDELQSLNPGFETLITTSFMELKHRQAPHGRGYRYLQKPYSLSGLLRAVSISIEQRKIKQ